LPQISIIMEGLNGKVVIITGGSKGLGNAAVKKFATSGATVVIWDIDETAGNALATQLQSEGKSVIFQKVNTCNEENISQSVEIILSKYSKIDVLINNAGITRDATLQKMDRNQWQQVIDINLTGVFLCTKYVSPHMIKQNSGRIINTSSIVGIQGNFGQTNYAASKAGVIAMTKTWAKELGRKGICVNAVAPGFILTDMVRAMPPEVLQKMSDKVPLGKLGEAEDVADTYLFLASDNAKYINGATISIDGGLNI
jgi:3-oxoacyl-[acyl-carrier protein] reductase